MPDPIFDSDAPPSGPAWGGAALAAGAAVLAGLVLGRRGTVGIAAGVAAAAGMKMMSGARKDDGRADADFFIPSSDVTLETEAQCCETRDWVDTDAVAFDHQVPGTTMVGDVFKEKSLPLLDDDGLPVEHVAVHPAYPEEAGYDFPLGPIIWEPGRCVQSSSDGTGETVWFGLQDVLREEGARLLPAPAMPDDAAAEGNADAVDGVSFGASSFMLLPDEPHEEDAVDGIVLPTLLPQPLPASSNEIFPATITPRPVVKTTIPQPRRAGEAPRQTSSSAAVPSTEGGKHALLSKLLPVEGAGRTGLHFQAQRHLEPVGDGGGPRRWPLVMTLCLLLVIGLFIAAGWWRGGELLQRFEDMPWLQGRQIVEKPLARPTIAEPVADAPKTAGRWMNAAPER